ncbi:MAG TPA: PSD1 and planctomycete cytochrome C domain-containing protein [Verrucomicrobiae bacterium]|nr:PSD1 and planctomycete cytochrome C domain-containing protein [Verrucomicrobiae bacterium]
MESQQSEIGNWPSDAPPKARVSGILVALGAATLLSGNPLVAAPAPKLSAQDAAFFESKIRPVLVENCYKCHSQGAEKVKGGLLLDTRDGVLKGGNTGPAIVPGHPDKSLLLTAVRYQDKDLQMPPNDKKLPDPVIADLEQWIRMGAPDPRTEGATAKANYQVEMQKARQHWAYQPVQEPTVPTPGDPQKWIENDVDRFILTGLQSKNLSPSPKADKATLLRRATFDLHGLPPTEKELADYLADDSGNAFATVVERLLASPRYGERWGRYWLDLAKYADTRGPQNQGRDNRYLWSWTYRDWVIRALNEDLAYDQFLLRQLAADQLELADKRDLAAMGYLTLGNRFGNNANDIIDDRIDLIGKSTMGLTLACARCHDHKFDPIPTQDYYSLHGVFSSCNEPREGPQLEEPKDTPLYRDYQRQLAAKEAAVEAFRDRVEHELGADWRGKIAEYLMALHDFPKVTNGMPRNTFIQKRGLQPQIANAWSDYLKNRSGKHSPIWTPWFAFSALPENEFAARTRELSAKFYANADKSKTLNPQVAKLFVAPPANLGQVAARYESLFVNVSKSWESLMSAYEARQKAYLSTNLSALPEKPTALPDSSLEEVRQVVYGSKSPVYIDDKVVQNFINRDNRTRDNYNALQRAVNDLKAAHPGAPPHAHLMVDNEKPKDSYVMIKGNPGTRGPMVPRQAPELLAGPDRQPFHRGSGRLEFAQVIASKSNPLTARVLVNRVWLHHFGAGLVATPDDFGLRSEPPSHPELLDFLAWRFMQEGWSLKKLHRLLMLSATYQESSEENARYAQIDPGNKYFWQMNRRRLDFESLRDTILYLGGRLDLEMGGPGVRLDAEPYPTRRTVYAFVDRARIPSMFQAFDFANPDLTTGRRSETIIPQQALFMMNSPLVVEQARNLTQRPDFKAKPKAEDKIKLLYQLIYQRAPSNLELKLALDYVKGEYGVTTVSPGALAWEYGYGEFDSASNRVDTFVQFASFNGRAWTVGNRQSVGRIGNVTLTANGGTPGNGLPHGAIRRWTARRDGFITIDGMLSSTSKTAGDAVRGWIVSSGTGLLGTFSPQRAPMPTRLPRVLVKRGDTIDFVLVGKGPFAWAPTIRFLEGIKQGEFNAWDAEKDFSGTVAPKQLEAWEKFAQVLLETNEMTFVN